MRFAYADPPYIGKARKHYAKENPDAAEVDHAELIAHLVADFDGWALSANSTTLRELLPLCPEGVRVLAWVKPFAVWKKGVPLVYAWEPVIMRPCRPARDRTNDWLRACPTLKHKVVGQKPEAFSAWLFECAGLHPEDEFFDLFPGSGAVGRAWHAWRSQVPMLAMVAG